MAASKLFQVERRSADGNGNYRTVEKETRVTEENLDGTVRELRSHRPLGSCQDIKVTQTR